MSQSDSSTVHIELFRVKFQILAYCYESKRFISFDKIDVIYSHSSLIESLLASGDPSDAHSRIYACGCI